MAGQTLIYGGSHVLFRALNFLFLSSYLTRRFPDQSEYSVHGIFYSVAALLLVLYTFRMETAFFRFGHNTENRDKVFSTASIFLLLTTISASVLLLLNAKTVAGWITEPDDARYITWYALITTFDTWVALPFARMRLENRAKKFAIYKGINALLGILFALIFLELIPLGNRQGWWDLVEFIERERFLDWVFIGNILASGSMLLLLGKVYFTLQWQWDTLLIKKMLRYAWPLVIVGISGVVNQLFDRVFIKEISGYTESGIYNGAIKIAVLMNLFATSFNYAAEPFFFSRMDKSDAPVVYAKVAQAFALVGSFVFLGILLYLDVVQILIGKNYRMGLVIIPYALLAYLFLGLHYNFSIWYKIKDKTYVGAWIGVGGMLITILGNFVLIPVLGITGSAVALMICFAFMAASSLLSGRTTYPIPYDLKRIIGYILYAVLVYGIAWGIDYTLELEIVQRLVINSLLLIGGLLGLFLVDRKNIMALLRF